MVVQRRVVEQKKQEKQGKEKDMTHETKQEQTPVRTEQPAPEGKAEQPKSPAVRKQAMVELTDADLQAVSGGSVRSGGGGNFDK